MMISPGQIRAARALLRLRQDELARRANVSIVTIRRLEAERQAGRVAPSTLGEVRQALERAGAEFIEGGVRRRPAATPSRTTLFEELRAISLQSARELEGRELLIDADLYDRNGLPA